MAEKNMVTQAKMSAAQFKSRLQREPLEMVKMEEIIDTL